MSRWTTKYTPLKYTKKQNMQNARKQRTTSNITAIAKSSSQQQNSNATTTSATQQHQQRSNNTTQNKTRHARHETVLKHHSTQHGTTEDDTIKQSTTRQTCHNSSKHNVCSTKNSRARQDCNKCIQHTGDQARQHSITTPSRTRYKNITYSTACNAIKPRKIIDTTMHNTQYTAFT